MAQKMKKDMQTPFNTSSLLFSKSSTMLPMTEIDGQPTDMFAMEQEDKEDDLLRSKDHSSSTMTI